MTQGQQRRWEPWIAGLLLIALATAYAIASYFIADTARTWVDEVTYLIKSWWYATGEVAPYTDADATWYMPLYFLQLGAWQTLIGQEPLYARLASAAFGLLTGLLVFDTVRRLTAQTMAGVGAAAFFWLLPASAFYYATATPIATVAFLHMAAMWLLVLSIGRPRIIVSLVFGMILAGLYFYRQNMILAIIVLLPLYIAGIGRRRFPHLILALIGGALVAVPLIMSYPDRLVIYALRLPVLTPLLDNLGLLEDSLALIHENTQSSYGLGLDFGAITLHDLLNAYLLPYAGVILAVLGVFLIARGPLKLLWIAPLYFLYLSAGHYLGALGYCTTCILPYTAYFVPIGAVTAGLGLAMTARWARTEMLPPGRMIFSVTGLLVAVNLFASTLATEDAYRMFPEPMLRQMRQVSEWEEAVSFGERVKNVIGGEERVLLIHHHALLPYATFRGGFTYPVQNINPQQSYRRLSPSLDATMASVVERALEREALWTDETQRRWIDEEYDVILYQEDPRRMTDPVHQRIESQFERIGSEGFRGWNVRIYRRLPPESVLSPGVPDQPGNLDQPE